MGNRAKRSRPTKVVATHFLVRPGFFKKSCEGEEAFLRLCLIVAQDPYSLSSLRDADSLRGPTQLVGRFLV